MSRMLRGLTTISYFADDVAAAAQWYRDVLGFEPYFSRDVNGAPAYVEFRIGDREHELGIIDRRFAPNPSGDGPAAPSSTGTSTTCGRRSTGCSSWARARTRRWSSAARDL